ncbi:hypothetical protein D3C71_1911440 [compost metagenome]
MAGLIHPELWGDLLVPNFRRLRFLLTTNRSCQLAWFKRGTSIRARVLLRRTCAFFAARVAA